MRVCVLRIPIPAAFRIFEDAIIESRSKDKVDISERYIFPGLCFEVEIMA